MHRKLYICWVSSCKVNLKQGISGLRLGLWGLITHHSKHNLWTHTGNAASLFWVYYLIWRTSIPSPVISHHIGKWKAQLTKLVEKCYWLFSFIFLIICAADVSPTKVLIGKSCHSTAILVTSSCSYFPPTRSGSYLNEWGESQNCNFSGYRDIKTVCLAPPVKSCFKSFVTLPLK